MEINKQKKRSEWRRKGWTIPDLRGKKTEWFILVKNLITLINDNNISDLDTVPIIPGIAPLQTWRVYMPFLKGIGLVSNKAGMIYLSETGIKFLNNPTQRQLADIINNKTRLFGEVLNLISIHPMTIKEVNKQICEEYKLKWNNLSNIRKRMDWLEVLGLIKEIGNHKWKITNEGETILKSWTIITPDILELTEVKEDEIKILEPPSEISILLKQLNNSPELHNKRNTYNIWAPSPNRIENLRIIVQASVESIKRNDFFDFVSKTFSLKLSSVESMLPFLKAAGFIEEVGRNIYKATPAAKAWIETGNDLDFIRILHSHMQFVGEMIKVAENDITRNDIYNKAKLYGLNTEKARWIAGFLIEAGLLDETQYLHLKATPLGMRFIDSLPLRDIDKIIKEENNVKENECIADLLTNKFEKIANRLKKTSIDPYAEGMASGVAFEEAITELFKFMGFKAKRIGGAGNTDVVIQWKEIGGKQFIAIIDAKSKSTGQVSHGDVNNVAIDTHRDKNNANYVAIVGAHFSGDTIKCHAQKMKFALITVEQLIGIAQAAIKLGLSLQEISLIFQLPHGLSQLNEIISSQQRKLDIMSNVISKFCKEQEQIGALSPRDLFLLLRDTSISPSLAELIEVFRILSSEEIAVLKTIDKNRLPENTMYILSDVKQSVFRLRTIATTIENSLIN